MTEKKAVLNVRSEIGKLKKVLLHRPGKEIENLTPDLMDRLLFDDIPYLEIAIKEHDIFADILRNNGVEVVYLEDLAAEAIADDEIKNKFVDEFIKEVKIMSSKKEAVIKEYLLGFSSNKDMIAKMMEGIRTEEIKFNNKSSLVDTIESNYPFVIDPMPNLYFTRDPFATIGKGISLNHMKTVTRNRETLFSKYIFKYHKDFKDADIPFWYNREEDTSMEGGDQLILSDKVIAIGISERTNAASIEKLAKRIFESDETFDTILAFDIPKKRAFMHLDTVFTMVDYDKFTIHPEIEGPLTVYSLSKGDGPEDLIIEKETMELNEILKKYLGLDSVTLIRCGNGNSIDAAREQWNDGSNTLAIAPGEVVVYSRNYVTNRLLEENGIKIHVMPSSELSRGRGGPRCMSMPLFREDI
ncbi:arginine deiminase [Paramaledivibacter caminithermalis]|jgi:arginine deiminase|uniref:Arginine deiminase n=1 Tax=Paramaledivibacter caminithermalis (strain DSM 15212 / CIP 107654 / DViRD3) TaxID=1121301 RepID=A0A1M6KHH8_PARC5|nr:arginine deiminase [Paramaledivibacter caminithermalis]SHJ58342.1 arginine deiminase [Paramaledivibacter caminithermalis DSM 15212]